MRPPEQRTRLERSAALHNLLGTKQKIRTDRIIHPVTVCCYEVPHHVCCVKEGWGNYHVARLKLFLPYHLLTLVSLEVSNTEGTNILRGNIFRALDGIALWKLSCQGWESITRKLESSAFPDRGRHCVCAQLSCTWQERPGTLESHPLSHLPAQWDLNRSASAFLSG